MKRELILYSIVFVLLYAVINSYAKISTLKIEVNQIQSSIVKFEDYNKLKADRAIKHQDNILLIKSKYQDDLESLIDINDFINELNKVSK